MYVVQLVVIGYVSMVHGRP